MRVNYCGAVWTIGSMVAGAVLSGAYTFVIHNAYGERELVSSGLRIISTYVLYRHFLSFVCLYLSQPCRNNLYSDYELD